MPFFGPPNIEKMKAKRDVEGLIKAINYQKDIHIRIAAAKALGEINDKRAFHPLRYALHDNDLAMREAAVQALRQIMGPSNLEFFLETIHYYEED